MTDGIDLKTCPFCGSEPNHFPVGLWYYVTCSNRDCTCQIIEGKKEAAIRKWNRRVGPWYERDDYKHRLVETIGQHEIHEVYYYDPPERIYTIWDPWICEEFETMAEAIQFVRKMEQEGERMTDEIYLKPCPFCGGRNIEYYDMEMFVGCNDCHIIVKPWAWGFGLSREITDKWNRRASE